MATAFESARLAAVELLIVTYENALAALAAGNIQTYKLDTGQSTTSVTRLNLTELENALSRAENRRATLLARCNGSSTHMVPAW